MPVREWLTRQEAANELGVSLKKIDRYMAAGMLTRHKARDGHGTLLEAAQVAKLAHQHKEGLPPASPAQKTTTALVKRADSSALPAILQRLLESGTPPEPRPYYIGVNEAARITGLPRSFVQDAVGKGIVRHYYVYERLMVNRLDLEKI